MDLIIAWIVFPLALGAITLGLGLLLERAADIRLPGVLVVPVGFAALVVVAQFAILTDFTAELAVPLSIVLAVTGLALSRDRWGGIDLWAVAVTAGAFTVFAAPAAFSGEPTFGGYAKLDDTATFLAITDHIMEHGRNLSGLDPSTYELTLDRNLASGYPLGAFVPFGVGRAIVGQDAAWVFQPYLAFLGAVLALTLYSIARRTIAQPWLAGLVAFVASQAAVLLGYSLWGGIKEMGAAVLLALIAATAPIALDKSGKTGTLVPLALAGGAMVGVLSLGGLVWLLPVTVGLVVAGLRFKGGSFTLEQAGTAVVLAGVFALPAIVTVNFFIEPARDVLIARSEKGLLLHSLSPLQIFGIWPVGDFRRTPDDLAITDVLIAVTALLGLWGVYWAYRRRAWSLLAYVSSAALGCLVIAGLSSPWVDAKAFAIVAPAFLLAALCGAVALRERSRVLSALGIAVIAVGVGWSTVFAYHDVELAPRDRFKELGSIAKSIEGEGPTLSLQYEPYATKHFLRKSDPEGVFELKTRQVNLQSAHLGESYTDIDLIQLRSLLAYRTIVMPRSPVLSRPPVPYRLVENRRFYEVWQRPNAPVSPRAAWLPLGSLISPSAPARCGQVLRLAAFAGPGGRLAAATAPTPILVGLGRSQHPQNWRVTTKEFMKIRPTSSGTLEMSFALPRAGSYDIWLGGSFRSRLQVFIDGRRLLDDRHFINRPQAYVQIGNLQLDAGDHTLTMRYDGPNWHPGSGGVPFALGPVALSPTSPPRGVFTVPVNSARELCGRRLDWIQIL